jgi:mono/diheme cytochrome c family protein
MRTIQRLGLVVSCLLLSTACGDDDEDPPRVDGGGGPDAPVADAGDGADAAPADAGPAPSATRGEYLVNVVLSCGDCHTPRLPGGMPDTTKLLAGVDCFLDVVPDSAEAGCLSSRNLTNHATGLMNRSDEEIKDMIANGERPDGTALHPFMPYYAYHALTDEDLDSIVLFLRTVPGVDHTAAANQPPWDTRPEEPAPGLGEDEMPQPTVVNEATMRGRYLAVVACLECHTPRTEPGNSRALDKTKLFAGGEGFPAAGLGLPSPPFPETIFSRNLTPHAGTGIGYTKAQIIAALKQGVDKEDEGICVPMPAGMRGYAGLTDDDASDIADYILALPAIENMIMNDCQMPEQGPPR